MLDSFYYVTVNLDAPAGSGRISLKWIDSSTVIPASSFYTSETLANAMTISIAPTSIPTLSTVDGDSNVDAGNLYTVTLKTKNSQGTLHVGTDDVFEVKLVSTDGSVPDQILLVTYSGAGVFKATVTPTIAGTYNVEANLTNDYTD